MSRYAEDGVSLAQYLLSWIVIDIVAPLRVMSGHRTDQRGAAQVNWTRTLSNVRLAPKQTATLLRR